MGLLCLESRCALTLCNPADPSGNIQKVTGGALGALGQECFCSIPCGREAEEFNPHVHHSRMDERTVHDMPQRASELLLDHHAKGKS